MVTAVMPKNRDRVWRKILSVLQGTATERAADLEVGGATPGRLRRHVWLCAGTPTTSATGMADGDLILDTTGDEVLRQIGANTFFSLTAEA